MDDLLVITVFGMLLNDMMGLGNSLTLLGIPWLDGTLCALLGVLLGALGGFVLAKVILWLEPRVTKFKNVEKALAIVCLMLVYYGSKDYFLLPICTLLGIMFFGIVLLERNLTLANTLSHCYHQVWVWAECLLFLMIGAEVDPRLMWEAGLLGIGILALGLLARSIGVVFSLLRTDLNIKERMFCVMAYWPKATVQAAIGGVALSGVQAGDLSMSGGLHTANTMLAMAVLSIFITAPLGALALEWSSEKLLCPAADDQNGDVH
jgi:NhaP-type Na+/H+ or K+/H+ antiporter